MSALAKAGQETMIHHPHTPSSQRPRRTGVSLSVRSSATALLLGAIVAGGACAKTQGSGFEVLPDGAIPDGSPGFATNGSDAAFNVTPGDGGAVGEATTMTIYPSHMRYPSGSLTAGNVPADPGSLFAQAHLDSSAGSALAYPADGTMLPPNMPDILFQWTAPVSANLFRLHFVEGTTTLDVYDDGTNATCTKATQGAAGMFCWESSPTDVMGWLGMASDDGVDVTFTIASLDLASPSSYEQSPTYTIHVSRTDITGAVFYWSTTAKGVRRGTFGSLATDGGPPPSPGPNDYVTQAVFPPNDYDSDPTCPSDSNNAGRPCTCAACHTLSRDGKKLAVSLPGDLLAIVDVVPQVPPPFVLGPGVTSPSSGGLYLDAGASVVPVPAGWMTFSPDDSKVIAASGALTLFDATSGRILAPVPTPSSVMPTMPDWSADGTLLAFTVTPANDPATAALDPQHIRHLSNASIATLSTNASGDSFTGYQVVAQSTKPCPSSDVLYAQDYGSGALPAGEAYANPMSLEDSNNKWWLVFSHADCESEEDPSAEIIVAPPVANAPQNHLVTANTAVGHGPGSNLTNGMPVWGPSNDPKIQWVAFTSTRDYGFVLSASPLSHVNDGDPSQVPSNAVRQLWIAAVDVTVLDGANDITAIDPSYPAFRFSAQDLSENNHRPFWTVDALKNETIVYANPLQ